jgi:hypothetical protein
VKELKFFSSKSFLIKSSVIGSKIKSLPLSIESPSPFPMTAKVIPSTFERPNNAGLHSVENEVPEIVEHD